MTASETSGEWCALGGVAAAELSQARDELHWALQPVAAAARALVPAREDDSHTNCEWLAAGGWLAGAPIERLDGARAALRLATPTLALLSADGRSLHELELAGQRWDLTRDWLSETLSRAAGKRVLFGRPPYQLPPNPASGSSFGQAPAGHFEELACWYANANLVLGELAAREPRASPVRCWPHHFDIAALISLEPGADAESARSIGVGMTPGDDSYPAPYLYVTPWPYPEAPELPALPAGARWHREGWLGAVLEAEALVAAGDAAAQHGLASEFVRTAVAACRALLGVEEQA